MIEVLTEIEVQLVLLVHKDLKVHKVREVLMATAEQTALMAHKDSKVQQAQHKVLMV